MEDRALPTADVQPAFPTLTTTAPLNVTTANALRVSDAYACVRVLADSISSLPLHAHRRTPQGRIPAGDNARAVQLLAKPAPGSTGVDLVSQIVVHLNVHGDAFVGKYRSDGEIVQLGLLPFVPEHGQQRAGMKERLLGALNGDPSSWSAWARSADVDPKHGTARRARDELIAAGHVDSAGGAYRLIESRTTVTTVESQGSSTGGIA